MASADALRRRLESLRFRGKWADVKGVAEDNDAIMAGGGFDLASDGDKVMTRVSVPALPAAESFQLSSDLAPSEARFAKQGTVVCVANIDTLTAALALGDACALSHANASVPGGRYRHGGRAQEEDLCRCLPQLWPSLNASLELYPLPPNGALVTRNLVAVRRPGTYERCEPIGQCTIVTAAMPCGVADRRPKGGWLASPWAEDVSERIRTVLHAAKSTKHANLVLGAWGCGAFGNPTAPVAALFKKHLASEEFRGAFEHVVFAILDPLGTGNLGPFKQEFGGK